MRQENEGDNEAAHNISQHDLQKCEIAIVSQARNANDGERAGLGGNYRKRDGPPWNFASGKKVVAQGAVALTKAQTEKSNSQQISTNDCQIETAETHHCGSKPDCEKI